MLHSSTFGNGSDLCQQQQNIFCTTTKYFFVCYWLTGEFNFRSNHTPVSSIAENSVTV